jgi:MFS family permease
MSSPKTSESAESDKSSTTSPRFFYGYIVVAAAFFILIATFGVHFTYGIFFKPLIAEFGWTRAVTSGAFSLSWIASGLLSIAIGGFNDRFGPRIMLTICGFFLGLGYLLLSQITAVWQLYLIYGVIIGVGVSTWVPLMSTIARWFVRRRTVMTGIIVAGSGLGVFIGPLVADRLISAYDWRSSYMILGGTVLIIVILAAQFLKRDPSQIRQVAYGEREAVDEFRSVIRGLSFREAVCSRQFWILFAMVFSYGFCLLTVQVHIAPYATDQGIPPATAASILSTIGGASIIARILLGNMGDRIGNKRAFIIGLTLMLFALVWLLTSHEAWRLYLFAIVFGFAFGDIVPQQSPLVAQLFGLSSHGLILGVISLAFAIAAAIGPFVAGYIFDITGEYQVAFLISIAICFIGLVFNIFLKSIGDEPGKTNGS